MTRSARPIQRILSLLLTLLLLFSALPLSTFAADNVFEGEITLTGKTVNTQFSLDASDMELFNLKKAVPGTQWKGKIHVKNSTYSDMEFSIISIASNLQDNTLFNALELTISQAGTDIYTGAYSATSDPISTPTQIPALESISYDVLVTLPKTAGNEVQNKEMDSTWTFEANYYGRFGGSSTDYIVHYVDEEGNKLLDSKEGTGIVGVAVIEKAPDIEGYTPDAQEKRLLLTHGKNEIIFVYSPITPDTPTDPTDPTEPIIPDQPTDPDTPTEPTNPTNPTDPTVPPETEQPNKPVEPAKPTEPNIQTGWDMTESNSDVIVWLIVAGICVIAAVLLIFRIRAEKAKTGSAKAKRKEGTTNEKK